MRITPDVQAWWAKTRDRMPKEGRGHTYIDYLEFWGDAAERSMREDGSTPIEGLRSTLALTEETIGSLPDGEFGHVLVTLVGIWEHGAEAIEGMTPLELKVLSGSVQELGNEVAESAHHTGS